jgi:hypothetical protein
MVNVQRPAFPLIVLMGLFGPSSSKAQAPTEPDTSATLAEVTQVRDAYVARIQKAGFACPIPVPIISVDDVPSFGNYDNEKNTIRTSDWALLKPQERAFFLQLAGPDATESDGRRVFDRAAHRWIFVHEMGHWWQACRKVNFDQNHYGIEYGANRIALAYWRTVDPTLMDTMMPAFESVLAHAPNPVPAGQNLEAYFNANYQELGPGPAYPWFQSHMVDAAAKEKPAPSFATVLAETK